MSSEGGRLGVQGQLEKGVRTPKIKGWAGEKSIVDEATRLAYLFGGRAVLGRGCVM